jgi:glucan biosynthesis protein C
MQSLQQPADKPTRLYYLDWLRVLAILGVFLYHAVHPFDLTDWHIKNAEQSLAITAVLIFVSPFGMPFFFMMAGIGTRFALQHRTPRQYMGERFKRLFVPFIFGCILLTPLMLYLEWMHKTQTGLLNETFIAFIASRQIPFGPQFFGWAGYHLWFLGFLFSYSILGIPVFLWLRGATGQRMVSGMLRLCERRGGILLAIVPLAVVQIAFRIVFTTNERFIHAIARDWRLIFIIAVATTAMAFVPAYSGDLFTWIEMPNIPEFYAIWTLVVINGWCWTILLLLMGKRFLDFGSRWLQYGQEAIVPFFVFHQPVIMLIAFFVLQWEAEILPKLLVVLFSSFVATVGLYELVIRPIAPLRTMFGMKPKPRDQTDSLRTRLA